MALHGTREKPFSTESVISAGMPEQIHWGQKGGEQTMMNAKRTGALMLCIALALVLAVSTVYIVHEADHDCSGEDCPICRMIAVNIKLLSSLGLAVIALLVLFFQLSGQAVRSRRDQHTRFFSGTLVSWKIRLDD